MLSRTFSISRLSRRFALSIWFARPTCCSGRAFSRRRSKAPTCSSRDRTRSLFRTSSSASARFRSSRSSVLSIRAFSPAMSRSISSRASRSRSRGSRSGCRIATRRQRVSLALFSWLAALMGRSLVRSRHAACSVTASFFSIANAIASRGRFSREPAKASSISPSVERTSPTSFSNAFCSVCCNCRDIAKSFLRRAAEGFCDAMIRATPSCRLADCRSPRA